MQKAANSEQRSQPSQDTQQSEKKPASKGGDPKLPSNKGSDLPSMSRRQNSAEGLASSQTASWVELPPAAQGLEGDMHGGDLQ